MDKTMKFQSDLVADIIGGRKTCTFRLFDDKDLAEGDVVRMVDKGNGQYFGSARLISVTEKALQDLGEDDFIGHSPYRSQAEMIAGFRTYYGDLVGVDTMAKIIRFKMIS